MVAVLTGSVVCSCADPVSEYVIKGLGHNVAFLRDVVRNEDFVKGDYSTSFIGKHYPEG